MLLPWVTPADVQAAPGAFTDGQGGAGWLDPSINADLLNQICCAASNLLYRRTGRQFAEGGTARIRPTVINRNCNCSPWWAASWGGWGTAWSLLEPWAGGEWGGCNCASSMEYMFPTSVKIAQVVVNGVRLQPGIDYVLWNQRRLIRMATTTPPPAPNSPQVWPCCQSPYVPPNSEGAWYVDYAWGKPVPPEGKLAALTLAIELAKAYSGNNSDLPGRVTNIARQGVTAVVMDPLTFVEKGLTGLPTVDLFIMLTNPYGLQRRASITSPDSIAPEVLPAYQEMVTFDQPVL